MLSPSVTLVSEPVEMDAEVIDWVLASLHRVDAEFVRRIDRG